MHIHTVQRRGKSRQTPWQISAWISFLLVPKLFQHTGASSPAHTMTAASSILWVCLLSFALGQHQWGMCVSLFVCERESEKKKDGKMDRNRERKKQGNKQGTYGGGVNLVGLRCRCAKVLLLWRRIHLLSTTNCRCLVAIVCFFAYSHCLRKKPLHMHVQSSLPCVSVELFGL